MHRRYGLFVALALSAAACTEFFAGGGDAVPDPDAGAVDGAAHDAALDAASGDDDDDHVTSTLDAAPALDASGANPCALCLTTTCTTTPSLVCDLLAFVTDETHDGQFDPEQHGYLDAFDAFCQQSATTAGISVGGAPAFRAWIFANTDGNGSLVPGNRLATAAAYYNRAGERIGTVAELANGPAENMIRVTGSNQTPSDPPAAWTGLPGDGGFLDAVDCSQWTGADPGFRGNVGLSSSAAQWQNDNSPQTCNTPAHVYCFQVP